MTTRPTTGNTLAWAVACERDQWGRAVAGNFLSAHLLSVEYVAVVCSRNTKSKAMVYLCLVGHVNVAPRHLTAEAETLLSATLIHEVL